MDMQTWKTLSPAQREAVRDNSELEPLLVGLEGCRIECDYYGERVRFQVGKSTGWKPVHLKLHNCASMGGEAITAGQVANIRIIKRAR